MVLCFRQQKTYQVHLAFVFQVVLVTLVNISLQPVEKFKSQSRILHYVSKIPTWVPKNALYPKPPVLIILNNLKAVLIYFRLE